MKLMICLTVLLLTMGSCLGCTSGGLRLTDSTSGILQICKNNEWKAVCSEDWGHLDAAVACRQLGYDGGYTQSISTFSEFTVDPVAYHCSGRENNLQTCGNEAYPMCSNNDGITVVCVQRNPSDPCNSGDIRLWGGREEYEGNIEICTDHGVWSEICDSSWNDNDAIVACRQLNYTNSIPRAYTGSEFGQRSRPMEYGGLVCQGTESSLQECAISQSYVETWSEHFFCNQRDSAGVRCTPRIYVNCTNGDLRLSGNSSGILHICKDNEWWIVCSEYWGHLDAAVVCRQLGYDGGYTQSTSSSLSPEGIAVDPVAYHCSGQENSLQTCDNETISWCSRYYVTTIVCIQGNTSDPCSSGDIRLWGGETDNEGNIEICTDHGVWSTICDEYWDTADAAVACRQLNYTNPISLPYRGSTFGQRIQPMEYGGLVCRGTESSLQQCAVSQSFVRTWSGLTYCNQGYYAGVTCVYRTPGIICKNGAVRLRGGYSFNNGLAEICLDGAWIGICQQSYTEISMHICKQLGYPRYTRIEPNFFLANRPEPLAYISSFRVYRCRSETSVLLDCVYNSTYSGISYVSTCPPHGVLCCPNDTVPCGFQLPTSDDITTPSTTSTPTISPTATDLTLSQTIVKTFHIMSDLVVCAYCSFTAGSEAEGCAVELDSEAYTYLFNMSRSTSGGGELSESVLDCFTVGGAGGYSVHVYEILRNGELGQRREKLPDVTVEGNTSGKENKTGTDKATGLTLSQTIVKTFHTMSDLVVCAYCSFTAGSEAEGCAVELESETHTHLFNMSRSTSGGGELSESVLDCFTVGGAGGYSVHVYEILRNGELGQRREELPDVTVEGNTSGKENKTGTDKAVVTLAGVLGLTLVGIVVTISIFVIIFLKKRNNQQSTTSAGKNDRDTDTATASPSENVDTPTIPIYEEVDLKPNYEEINLSTNASYSMVKK